MAALSLQTDPESLHWPDRALKFTLEATGTFWFLNPFRTVNGFVVSFQNAGTLPTTLQMIEAHAIDGGIAGNEPTSDHIVYLGTPIVASGALVNGGSYPMLSVAPYVGMLVSGTTPAKVGWITPVRRYL